MIINKATSDALLVESLSVLEANGKPVKNVTVFDTSTREATLSEGGPITAASFLFTTEAENIEELLGLLDEDLKPLVAVNKKFTSKKAMDSAASPDEYLLINTFESHLRPYIATCTNCSTSFLVYLDADDNIWDADRVNNGDTFKTLTQVSGSELTCDNCSSGVSICDRNPH